MNLRCIHRHTFDEHPNCFYNGLVKTDKVWFIELGLKVAYFDIETSALEADFGFMLSWAIKERGGPTFFDCIDKDSIFSYEFDKEIVKTLLTKLKDYDIIVTYYGSGFDIPFVNTRALYYGLEPITNYYTQVSYKETKNNELKIKEKVVPVFYHWDLYYTVRNKLALSRNSLENVTQFFGIEGKTKLDRTILMKARYGDEKSLKYILDHNKQDVIILERLHNRLLKLQKWTKKGA